MHALSSQYQLEGIRMRKSVGIDLDSTLNCLNEKWLEDYNRDYNDTMTMEDITHWDWHDLVKPECGKKLYHYLGIPQYFYNLGVKEDSQEVTRWILEHFDIYVVTAYGKYVETAPDKFRWLREYFPHIDERNVIFMNDKSKLRTDFLIDDGPHNIEAFLGLGIVVDYAYNRYLDKSIPRVRNWKEIQKFFEAYI